MKKLNWELDSKYIHFSSNNATRNIFYEIGPGIQYKFKVDF
jgi:hypothetical protein